MTHKKFYAVAVGRKPGIYTAWDGDQGAARQVQGFPNARYKGFASQAQALEWLDNYQGLKSAASSLEDRTLVYTDGSCLTNPGPGGYGVVILQGQQRRELSAGFSLTTNNRMELLACVAGMRALHSEHPIEIFTDSYYVVNAITKGWAARWQANGWTRTRGLKVQNADLWMQLLSLAQIQNTTFHWIPGHAGHPENERCDILARQAASRTNLPADPGYPG